jgi:hypothetical protein
MDVLDVWTMVARFIEHPWDQRSFRETCPMFRQALPKDKLIEFATDEQWSEDFENSLDYTLRNYIKGRFFKVLLEDKAEFICEQFLTRPEYKDQERMPNLLKWYFECIFRSNYRLVKGFPIRWLMECVEIIGEEYSPLIPEFLEYTMPRTDNKHHVYVVSMYPRVHGMLCTKPSE